MDKEPVSSCFITFYSVNVKCFQFSCDEFDDFLSFDERGLGVVGFRK